MVAKAFITGCAGPVLSTDEMRFFEDERPFGLILFRRNCETPAQIVELVGAFRAAVGHTGAPVLIDQEGGRVQRLRPPHWPDYPPAARIAALDPVDPEACRRAAWLGARLIAADLADVGIDVDCLPLLDVNAPEGHAIIGDRAYGSDPARVARLGRAVADGLLAGGVLPVIKHIPGHGRARADSHVELPTVETDAATLLAVDAQPFAELADLPLAMTAHVVYRAFDSARPATLSSKVVGEVIRDAIGFDGLLMTDDVSMGALSGTIEQRSALSLAAGCDVVLHCNGLLDEMRAVASAVPELAGKAAERAERALSFRKAPEPFDREAGRAEFDALIARVSGLPVA